MRAGHGRDTFVGTHHLAATGLFTDEALIAAFDSHLALNMQIATMGADPAAMGEWKLGTVEGVPGADILAAIKTGRLWLNVLHLEENPLYRDIVDQIFEDIEIPTTQRRVTLIISSPGAQVLYHVDPEQVLLMHVRGHKDLYLYPADDPSLVRVEDLERIFTGESYEELPFDPAWDKLADVHHLEPGRFALWAHNGPHRVSNGEDFNVSLSCSYYTADAKFKERVYRANRYFRQFSPVGFRDLGTAGFGPAMKVAAFRVMQKIGVKRLQRVPRRPLFVVDPAAPFGRRLFNDEVAAS